MVEVARITQKKDPEREPMNCRQRLKENAKYLQQYINQKRSEDNRKDIANVEGKWALLPN